MTQVTKPECKLVIAGPGAGKTYNMVQKVLECTETLHPARFCAVITYTNAATDEIKSRLAQKGKIPENVFIGTIHSFLNRFIIIPYLSLINNNVVIDKTFLQISSDDIVKKMNVKTPKQSAIIRKRVYESLNKQGLITFDQTINLSLETIKNEFVKRIVCKRLQYLFIDEFQDVNNKQFEIIEYLRKAKQTQIYCVGDPEQYISGFQNDSEYKNIPILKAILKKDYCIENPNINNHRSSFPIVNFLNNFNKRLYNDIEFQQIKIENKNTSQHFVFFLNEMNLNEILGIFKNLAKDKGYSSKDVMILSKKNKTINAIQKLEQSYKLLNKNRVINPVEIMINNVTTISKKHQSKIFDEANITKIQFRKFILKCLKGNFESSDDLKNFTIEELKIEISDEIEKNKHKTLVDFENFEFNSNNKDEFTLSNIHNAKGLESQVVLCIAKNNKELKLWLETNSSTRLQTIYKLDKDGNKKNTKDDELDDYPRLGYVAFSRARELLCIACLEQIDTAFSEKLALLNVKIIP